MHSHAGFILLKNIKTKTHHRDAEALRANAPFDRPHRGVVEVEGGKEDVRTRGAFPLRRESPSPRPRRSALFTRLLLLLLLELLQKLAEREVPARCRCVDVRRVAIATRAETSEKASELEMSAHTARR